MSAGKPKRYRRSWKNLLINKDYQLRFTLFMVALTAGLMALLGWWVMHEAGKATEVSINGVRGLKCPEIPELDSFGGLGMDQVEITEMSDVEPVEGDAATGAGSAGTDPAGKDGADQDNGGADGAGKNGAGEDTGGTNGANEDGVDEESAGTDGASTDGADEESAGADGASKDGADADTDGAAGAGADGAANADGAGGAAPDAADADEPTADRARPEVTIESTSMVLAPQTLPPGYVERVIRHHQCQLANSARMVSLEAGHRRIFWILCAVGAMLLLGLTAYSIKMTHRVAGPLHKITLYLDKVRNGVYDQVYDLRRGDQLVEFYEHFKAAHAGLRDMQERDVEVLRAVIKAAEAGDIASRSPELAAMLEELRELLARKEESLV